MDESSFEIDTAHVVEASRRFPTRRLAPTTPTPDADVSYLAAPGTGFGRHAWDEGGHL